MLLAIDYLLLKAEELELAIQTASGDARRELHQKLHHTLENIHFNGWRVPAHLHKLDLALTDEEIEDSFNNMPV